MSEQLTPSILKIIEVFERLHVPYFIGGSIASIIHGVIRTTLDADIIADLHEGQVDSFVTALAVDYYLDAASIHDAIRYRRCFNLIELASMFKIDIFIPRWNDYLREEFSRRQPVMLSTPPEHAVCIASIEDTILSKLDWYRLGGHVSDRQWRDVIELVKIHRDELDLAYLKKWASALQVEDILDKVLH